MSTYSVLPGPPDCQLCDGTGWTTIVDGEGDAYAIRCPEGCPSAPHVEYLEVPY